MKTYKRELAIALFIPLFYTVWRGDVAMAQVLVWPTFTFAALSFGLDWHGKQLREGGSVKPSDGGRTQRSSKHPSRENYQPEFREYPEYRPDSEEL